jgi:hypothetical protein
MTARTVLRQDQQERITPLSIRALVPGLKLLVMSVALVVAGLGLAPLKHSLDASSLRIGEEYVASILIPFEPVLQAQLPPGVTLQQLGQKSITSIVTEQINATLKQLTEGRSLLVAVVLVLLALLAARVLVMPFAWVAAWLTLGALVLMLRLRVFTKQPKQIIVERILL